MTPNKPQNLERPFTQAEGRVKNILKMMIDCCLKNSLFFGDLTDIEAMESMKIKRSAFHKFKQKYDLYIS